MKVYKVNYSRGMESKAYYFSTKAKAVKAIKEMKDDQEFYDVDAVPKLIELPTTKERLVDWINIHTNGFTY